MYRFSTASVGLPTPTLMYLIVEDKATFDAINLPLETYERSHAKTSQMGDITVIIQYWLPEAREEITNHGSQ